MAERKDDRPTPGAQNASAASGRAGGKPSFADTSIAADEQEQTATRREGLRTTDEAGETTTAAVPPTEPKEAMGDLTRD